MTKVWLALVVAITLATAGLVVSLKESEAMKVVAWPLPEKWVEKYGNSDDSQIAYDLNLLKQIIVGIDKRVKAIENDPNKGVNDE